jgi:hypothetical protein
MSDVFSYRVRIAKSRGLSIEERSIEAESVSDAVLLAAKLAAELEAVDFSIKQIPPKVLPKNAGGPG